MPDQPWLPFYGDTPATIVYPDATLFELFELSAHEYHDYDAFEYLGERLTYGDLERLVGDAARGLRAIGVQSGDRVAIIMPNTPHVPVLLYAANRIGAAVSLVQPESPAAEVATLLDDLEPGWIVAGREHVNGLLSLNAARSARSVIACSLDEFGRRSRLRAMELMRQRFGVDQGGLRVAPSPPADRTSGATTPPVISWDALLRGGEGVELPAHRELHRPTDLAIILYTGGTTATPRGVMHGDRQLTAVALQMQVQGPLLAGQTLLCAVPFAHGFGVAVAVHASVSAGARSVLLPHSTPRSLARTIRRTHPEYLIGVPATYAELVMDRVFRRTRHRSLMGAFCGGDRLPRWVRERFATIVRRRGGAISVREGYGLTETVTACTTMPDAEERPGSVGVPYPDTNVAIAVPVYESFDPQSEPPLWLGPDRIGEILVSGPTVMDGYWRDEEATRRSLHPDEEGRTWLRTGDLGRMDENGFLAFVERADRVCVAGGVEIHPGLTELVLSEHAEVLETCVTVDGCAEQPHLTAHVAPSDPDRDPSWLERHLRESLQTLEEPQQPTDYAFHARLPRTLAGVIDERRLAVEPAQVHG